MPDNVLWRCARSAWTNEIYLAAIVAILPAIAIADGGAVRASKREGNCQVTVFTEPTPLREGPVDVSVFVQVADTGRPILGNTIDIEIVPRAHSSEKLHVAATVESATNKLFQAAHFNLPDAGSWDFTVNVRRPTGNIELHFELDVADSLPPWRSLWLWFCWPFLFVVLCALADRPSRGIAAADAHTIAASQSYNA
jgi:hypothetical protein